MQLKHLLAGAVAALAPAAAQITINPTTMAQSVWPRISSDLDAYYSSLATMTDHGVALAEIATATGIPPEFTGDFQFNDEVSLINAVLTGTPDWLAALPTDAQAFLSSYAAAEASIINKDTSAGSRVGRGLDWGVASLLVAGVVGTIVGAVVL